MEGSCCSSMLVSMLKRNNRGFWGMRVSFRGDVDRVKLRKA